MNRDSIHDSQEEFRSVLDMELHVMCKNFSSFELEDREAAQSAQAKIGFLTKNLRSWKQGNKKPKPKNKLNHLSRSLLKSEWVIKDNLLTPRAPTGNNNKTRSDNKTSNRNVVRVPASAPENVTDNLWQDTSMCILSPDGKYLINERKTD